ncbi:hypothetical protein BASA83_011244 [Batrachochytrium salamandrivorans]|nr:hypothetical protein BASA83_011244 [Batrachochytrium salamandrivorans]
MKVGIFVAAVMVITSVNASRRRRILDWFRHGGGRSRPVFSQDLSRDEWAASRSSDHAKKVQYDDSNMDVAGKDLPCSTLISVSEELHRNLIDHVDEYRSHLPLLYTLQERAENLKLRNREEHSALFERVNAILQEIKGEFTDLKKKYSIFWRKLETNSCLSDSVHLISLEDMERIGIFLDEQINLREFTKEYEKGVIFLDRQ